MAEFGEDQRPDQAADGAGDDQVPADAPFPQYESGALLRGPEGLTAPEASQILGTAPGRVVVWAGERRSGKTTLTVELYERHRTGRATTTFAGSQTLPALEARIHPARAASLRLQPHSERTELDPDGRNLLHLAVSQEGSRCHLLFADVPGEVFRQVRDSETEPSELPLLTRADKLAVLVDGELLASTDTRSAAVSFARQLVARLADGGVPRRSTQTALVLTKADKLTAAGGEALAYWERKEADLHDALRAQDPAACVFRTAARVLAEGADIRDDGMETLMNWLLDEPTVTPDPPAPTSSQPADRLARLQRPKAVT